MKYFHVVYINEAHEVCDAEVKADSEHEAELLVRDACQIVQCTELADPIVGDWCPEDDTYLPLCTRQETLQIPDYSQRLLFLSHNAAGYSRTCATGAMYAGEDGDRDGHRDNMQLAAAYAHASAVFALELHITREAA